MSDPNLPSRENSHESPRQNGKNGDEMFVAEAAQRPTEQAKGQPAGLWVLFVAEMWERFAYYGMKAILILYLTAPFFLEETEARFPGFGWSEGSAGILFGWYNGLVYLTPILGGWLADRFLGTHRSVVIGGWVIAAGHFCLALSEFGAQKGIQFVAVSTAPVQLFLFMLGLFLIIVGTGFFKPCCTVMVGQLYGDDDPRRDSGFTIFYMGINVGAFFGSIVTGTLAVKYGWHYGFIAAGVGMLLGLFVYQVLRPLYLQGIGLPPVASQGLGHPATAADRGAPTAPTAEPVRLSRVERDRLIAILIMVLFTIAFWLGFEQAGGSLNLFAENSTDRSIASVAYLPGFAWLLHQLGLETVPAAWFQSINPAVVVLFAPVFAWLWIWLDRRGLQPSTPVKFGVGLVLLSLGYVVMIFGAIQVQREGLAGWQWLFMLYVLHTWGELCLSPVGLSMVTRLSPPRYVSLMMGIFFLSNFFANLGAGYLLAFSSQIERGHFGSFLGGQADFFLFLALLPAVAGAVILVLSPRLKRMMHGLH